MLRSKKSYCLTELLSYVNWAYFYHAWQVADKAGQERLRDEAVEMTEEISGKYRAHTVFVVCDANSDGDDILIEGGTRLPMLRQQTGDAGCPSLCLADFVRPLSQGKSDRIGLFAATVDIGMETDFMSDGYRRMMMQLIADRMAEAAAERMHEDVRKHYWGYAPDERLAADELFAGKYQGIRPAVGYPSMPDQSLNFILSDVTGMKDIGIRLTSAGAMKPHASVSGLMISHPQSRYFTVGKIGCDQLSDYAARRGLPVGIMRRFLASNLQ